MATHHSNAAIELFDQAAELPPAERRQFIDTQCADPEIRREVESLLAAYDQADGFLSEHTTPQIEPYTAGARIGHFELLEPIGEGGFARVFRARQSHPIRREVALKLIKLGMDTRAVIARFELERQALAMMDHPNIAAVYDAGATDTGRPFFVMELVRGSRITQFCDAAQLSVRQRVRLFVDVCHAVQHAHTKGILHRDLKPSNILVTTVDGRPLVKVIDFGIAKAVQQRLTEMTLLTQEQQLLGTPQYMSPEQALSGGADVDTRSDIFSLGAVLCELLSGLPPLEAPSGSSSALTHLQKLTSDQELPRASSRATNPQLRRELRGELDWIIGKCLEKDRARRYETAAALAADLQAYLENRPITAAPPAARYRAQKFVRRNAAAVVAASIVALSLMAGTILTAAQAVRATRAERLAHQRLEDVESANAGLRAVNEFLTNDMIGAAAPSVTRGQPLTVQEALDNAAAALDTRFQDTPLIEASVRASVAMAYLELGHAARAEPHAQRALELRTRVLGADHAETLGAANNYGGVLNALGRYTETEQLCRAALERARTALGEDHRHTLSLRDVYMNSLLGLGRWSDAEPLARQGWEATRRALGDDQPQTVTALNNYARVLQMLGRQAEAEPLFKDVLEARRRTLGDEHPDTLTGLNNYALVIKQQGRFAEAEPLYREALELRERVLGPEHRHTITSLSNYARALESLGILEESERLSGEALDRARRSLGADHPDTLTLLNNHANLVRLRGRPEDAEPLFREALERRRRALGPAHPQTIATLNLLADLLQSLGRDADAEPLFDQLFQTAPAAQIPPAQVAQLMARHGPCLVRLARYQEAEPRLREAYRRLCDTNQSAHERTRETLAALAEVCDRTGRTDEAADWRAQLQSLPTVTTP